MAGRLRNRVRFQKWGETVDEYGRVGEGWENLSPDLAVAADIQPMGGNETLRAERVSSAVKFEIRIRYSAAAAAVTAEDHRAVDVRSGETFNIAAVVDPTRRRRWLHMTCEAGLSDG